MVSSLRPCPNPPSSSHRSVALNVPDLERSERAFHLQLGYMLPLNEEISVHVTIGPSFFSVHQDVVSDVTFTEIGPRSVL